MWIIQIAALPNGAHRNQTIDENFDSQTYPGWAAIPVDMEIPESFPFVDLVVHNKVVVEMTPREIPEPVDDRTSAQKREDAYNTDKCIFWENDYITVTEAALLWQYYAAEGNLKAGELTTLISAAKAEIRQRYPDEN